MANPEHLQILKQGIAAWNAWREENEGIRLNLYDAGPDGANLIGADLSQVILAPTIFSNTSLTTIWGLRYATTSAPAPSIIVPSRALDCYPLMSCLY